jgi:hypothetical protein
MYLATNFILVLAYLYQLIFLSELYGGMSSTKSSSILLKILEIHYTALLHWTPLLVPLALAWLWLFSLLDPTASFFVAISRRITVAELAQPFNHRHLFDLTKSPSSDQEEASSSGCRRGCSHSHHNPLQGSKKRFFKHQKVSICGGFFNLVRFFLPFCGNRISASNLGEGGSDQRSS